jgi:hypothetical protein
MRHYTICGLTVAADLDLPIASAAEAAAPDVIVHRAVVPTVLRDARGAGPTWQIAPGRILLRIPGVARFLMSEGRELAYAPDENRSTRDLEIFLLGSAFGALLHQRGVFPLRAGAVAVDGHAVLFCGASGAGKSTLVAALSVAGYPVISDDICLVRFEGSASPLVVPEGRRLNLWADAIAGLDLQSHCGIPVRPGIRKYWVNDSPDDTQDDTRASAMQAPLPLRAAYFFRLESTLHRAGIESLSLLQGADLMRAGAWHTGLVSELEQEAEWLDLGLSAMRGDVPHILTRPLSFDAIPRCIEGLQSHWRALGLTTRGHVRA